MTELEARAGTTVIVWVSPGCPALQTVQKSTLPLSLPHHVEEASNPCSSGGFRRATVAQNILARRRRAEELCGKRRARRFRDSRPPTTVMVSRSCSIALFIPQVPIRDGRGMAWLEYFPSGLASRLYHLGLGGSLCPYGKGVSGMWGA